MAPPGPELPAKSTGNTPIRGSRGSKSGNIHGGSAPGPPATDPERDHAGGCDDPDLDRLIRAWPTLRESTRTIIVGIIADAEARQGGRR